MRFSQLIPILSCIIPAWRAGAHVITRQCPGTSSGTYQKLPVLPGGARGEHGAVALSTKLYVIGGIVIQTPGIPPTVNTVGTMEVYDTVAATWSTAAPLPVPMNHPNIAVADGKIYVLGGLSEGEVWKGLPDAFEYDPTTDSWTRLPPLPVGTERGSAIVGVSGEWIILAGGVTQIETTTLGPYNTVSTVTAYNTLQGMWATWPDLPEGREHAGGVVVGDSFYVVGGRFRDVSNVKGSVYVISVSNPTEWQERNPMPTPRGGVSVTAVGSKIFTFGGEGSEVVETGGVFNETEVYDTEKDCWTKLVEMDIPRHGFAAVTIGDKIYIPGGSIKDFQVTDAVSAFIPPRDL